MAGGVASALAAAARRGGRELTGDLGLFEVDEFWLGAGGRGARAARDAARQPVPRPARPLRRAGDDRRPLGRGRAATTPRGARAQRRRPARRRPRPGAATPLYFGVDDDSLALPELQHARDSKHCRRCGHAYAYEAIYLAHLGHYHCPNCGQERPAPTVDGDGRRARGSARPRSRSTRGRRVELPLPGLYNVYNALGAAALTPRWAARRIVAGLRGRRARVRPGRDARPRRPADLDPARQEPGGANEVLRTLGLEGERARPARRAQRPHRRRPRRLMGVGRRLGAAGRPRAPHDVLGHACGGAGAAAEVRGLPGERIAVVDELAAALDAALAAAKARSTRPHLHGAAGAARAAHARGHAGRLAMNRARSCGTTSSAAATTPTSPLWHELAAAPDGVLDVGAGTGRVALGLARAGHAVTALGLDAVLLDVLSERARAAGAGGAHGRSPTRAFGARPAVRRSSSCRCRRSSCSRRPRRLLRRRRRALGRAGGWRAIATGWRVRRRRVAPAPDFGEIEGWALRLAADRRPASTRTRTDRARPPAGLARRRAHASADAITLRPSRRPSSAEEAARARPGGRGARQIAGDRRARRLRGGGVPCLSCASAPSTPT